MKKSQLDSLLKSAKKPNFKEDIAANLYGSSQIPGKSPKNSGGAFNPPKTVTSPKNSSGLPNANTVTSPKNNSSGSANPKPAQENKFSNERDKFKQQKIGQTTAPVLTSSQINEDNWEDELFGKSAAPVKINSNVSQGSNAAGSDPLAKFKKKQGDPTPAVD